MARSVTGHNQSGVSPAHSSAGLPAVPAPDWAADTADRIESFVESVRRKTAVPLTKVARAIVYGIVAGVMGLVVLLLLVMAAVRALDTYLPGEVWSAHLVLGVLFTAIGLWLWRKRTGERHG